MSKRALAAEVSFFDILLCIIPRTTGIGHEDCQCEAAGQSTYEQSEHTGNAEYTTYDDGDSNGKQ